MAQMRLWLIAGLVFLSAPVLAADSLNLDQVAGVYKDRFESGFVDGSTFQAENVLEIVKLSSREAYVRFRLKFYNGHICAHYGVSKVEGADLVYRKRTSDNETCVLSIRFGKDKVVISEQDGVCRSHMCGMRGGLAGIDFDAKSRRTIRYMPRLLASRQYREAMAERGK
jgi:hypothetical protein